MKRLSLMLALVILALSLSACTGTPVIYMTNCTCPTDAHTNAVPDAAPAEGALKTGLAIIAGASKSAGATAEANGKAEYDVTVVGVLVDDKGIIRACIIDSAAASAEFDANGAIVSDINKEILTKNELGEAYGMKKIAKSKYEWNEQAAALAQYAVGKTVEEMKNGCVNESGKAADADLASVATITIAGYVDGIVKAAENAEHLGAMAGDELRMAVNASLASTTGASAEKAGNVQLDLDCALVTVSDGKITSCHIDSLQAKVAVDASGAIASDLSSGFLTKNELGENYGMKNYGARFEWNEQAKALSDYVVGMNADEVTGIKVNEKTAPSEADLAASVSIAIGGYKALIAEAAK